MEFSFLVISNDKYAADQLLEQFKPFPEFHWISTNTCYEAATRDILKYKPNIVFLDLDDRGQSKSPFVLVAELYQYLDHIPEFIALSRSRELAYEVIKSNFIDYLLKPLSEFDFLKCILHFKKTNPRKALRICLKSYSDYHFLDLNEVVYLHADNNTTDFHLTSDSVISGYKTLKVFEKILPDNFVRIHNSYIINTNLVERINFGKSQISLKNNKGHFRVPFSKSYRGNVNALRENILLRNLSVCEN